MRLKKNKQNKTNNFSFRCTDSEANKIQAKANIYNDGNVSEYLVYAALNFIPGKEDLDDGKKKRRG
jgi:hypothetical protein